MVTGFGDPAAVSAAADSLRRAATDAERAHSAARNARPELWSGKAADAYNASLQRSLPAATRLANSLSSAAGTLTRYAAAQSAASAEFASSQATFDRAAGALRENPLNVPAAFSAAHARLSAFGALGQLQQAAATAASELRAGLGEDGDGRPWWDPFGWFTDPEDPDERVTEGIFDDDAFDVEDVAQGQIGDCFMLVSIVSLLNTDAGDDFIRENVRWDSDKEGFWVTIYPGGEAKEVFVEHVFGNGAKQNDWNWWIFGGDKPSIAALYESAIRQEYGYSYIDGGVPADAMELITGKRVEVVENSNYAGLSSSQVDGLRETLNAGGQVAISSPRTGEHQITVSAPDGSTREIDVVNTHAYAVTRIDADGSVWMRNPWGPGNSADGGGEFRVSAEDVADLFWRASSTNVTQ